MENAQDVGASPSSQWKQLQANEEDTDPVTTRPSSILTADLGAKLTHTMHQMRLCLVGAPDPRYESVPCWATRTYAYGEFLGVVNCHAGGFPTKYEFARIEAAYQNGFGEFPIGNEEHRQMSALYEFFLANRIAEEGALLVFAWLCEHDFVNEAQQLLNEVSPHFGRLRFHPKPTDTPEDTTRVSLQTVQDVKSALIARGHLDRKPPVKLVNWLILGEDILQLWLETVNDPTKPARRETMSNESRFATQGRCAWPCQRYPDKWVQRASELVDRYAKEPHRHDLEMSNRKAARKLSHMVECAKKAIVDPKLLTEKDVSEI